MTKATIIPSLTNNPPSRANPAAFPTDGDSFLNDLPDVVSGVNTVVTELNTWNSDISELQYSAGLSATNASNSKDTSLGNARLAASWFLSEWVSGTTYPAGQIVYSNVDGREYKRITAGAGTTDPSSDTTNWEPLGWEYITNYPDIRPTLDLNFASSQAVDPRITFTRNSIATYFDKFGVMQTAGINRPRIDFDPVTGECKGLLIEQQRTNLLTYSSDFTNAVWIKDSATITANTIVAPDGTISGSKLVATVRMFWFDNTGITGAKVQSIYAKAEAASTITISVVGGQSVTGGNAVTVNLLTGAVTSGQVAPNVVVTSVGNGWYRIAILVNVTVASGNSTYWQTGATTGVYIWGAQLEAGSFPTSYIPTTTAQVTRAADSAVMTGANFSSWYRQDEGTLFAQAYLQFSSGSVENDLVEANDGTQVNYFGTRAGVVDGYQAGQLVSVAANGVSRARNGVIRAFVQPTNQPPKTTLQIGVGRLYYPTSGWYQRIAYYPKRLPNATLQAITQP